jgi:hypothetical protein
MKLKKIIVALTLLFWPLGLFFKNTPRDFLNYLVPTVIILITFFLFKHKKNYYFLPLLVIPFISPKLILIPILVFAYEAIINKKRVNAIFLFLALLFSALFIKSFWGQTIFHYDYEARQTILRNTYLYPNIPMARFFQNKTKIISDKLSGNLFSLTDLSNYYFGSHPRENNLNNQNLDKFPYFALPLLLLGIYFFNKDDNKKFILPILIASFINLLVLNNFDRNDFVLFFPLALIHINGIEYLENKLPKKIKYYYWIFLIFSVQQLARLVLINL